MIAALIETPIVLGTSNRTIVPDNTNGLLTSVSLTSTKTSSALWALECRVIRLEKLVAGLAVKRFENLGSTRERQQLLVKDNVL